MEILGIEMKVNIRFFVELIIIKVFNSKSYIILNLKTLEVSLPYSLAFSTWNL